MPAKPRYASTVVLLRGTGPDRVVYMMKRNPSMAFLGGFYVFPGGAVSRTDCAEETRSLFSGLEETGALDVLNRHVDPPFTGVGFWAAAIRETFEEAGVLLARAAHGPVVSFRGREKDFAAARARLHSKDLVFWDFLREEKLTCAADLLEHIDHWVTPEFSPIRFDTHFFRAQCPEGQDPSPDAGETVEGVWLRPKDALLRGEKGQMPMIPPTVATLNRLCGEMA